MLSPFGMGRRHWIQLARYSALQRSQACWPCVATQPLFLRSFATQSKGGTNQLKGGKKANQSLRQAFTKPPTKPKESPCINTDEDFVTPKDDKVHEVTLYLSEKDSRVATYTGLIGCILVVVVFYSADKLFSLTKSGEMRFGLTEDLTPYVMESMSQDSTGMKVLGFTCVSIFAWWMSYMYKQYIGRQLKELTLVRRQGDIFLRLGIFKVQGPPRYEEFPLSKVTCPQLQQIPQSAAELDITPNVSFKAYTLKIDGEVGWMNEGYWMRRHAVKDRRALWQLFNQERVPPEHNIWLNFLYAKKVDPSVLPYTLTNL